MMTITNRQDDMNRLLGRLEQKVEMLQSSIDPTIKKAVSESSIESLVQLKQELTNILDNHFAASCKCPLPDCKKPAVVRVMALMEDLGEGDVNRGIAAIRKNAEWVKDIRIQTKEHKKMFIGGLISIIITAISALVLAFIGLGKGQ